MFFGEEKEREREPGHIFGIERERDWIQYSSERSERCNVRGVISYAFLVGYFLGL